MNPHPLTRLVAVSVAITALLYGLFFHFSERIWALHDDVPLNAITPWARWAMYDRDGAEPQFLLALVLSLMILTGAAMRALDRIPGVWCTRVVAGCFGIGVFFLTQALPLPPFMWPSPSIAGLLAAECGVLVCAALAWRFSSNRAGQLVGALVLVPVCFLASSLPLHDDLACVLAPALRLRLGEPLPQVYFQYDVLPSLVAFGWSKLGGNPEQYPLCTAAFYYLLFGGCFFAARRMFHNKQLAGLLLVALIVVRIYAIRPDANASPQVTPLRLDLWIYLLGLALTFGLRHWSVGLTAGLFFFVSRSIGMLYLGGYALALVADFFARRHTTPDRPPLWHDISDSLRETAASLALLGTGVAAGIVTFGGLVPPAVATYHHLGLGMMRISSYSSYWWVLPFLAMAGWLAFSRYRISDRRSAAALFVVALAISNSIYFFGRSHEHNLLNISASLLFCVFLCLDEMAATTDRPGWARNLMPAAPWIIVAVTGLAYSGGIMTKTAVQLATVTRHAPLPGNDDIGPIECNEIGPGKVFIYSAYEYWFNERCHYIPQGEVQPFLLQPVQARALEQLDGLLNSGYRIVVPKMTHWNKVPGEYTYNQFEFDEMEAALPGLEQSETEHYKFYRRPRPSSAKLSNRWGSVSRSSVSVQRRAFTDSVSIGQSSPE